MGNATTKDVMDISQAGVSEDALQELECPICYQIMLDRQPRALSCLHTFCDECLHEIKDKNHAYSSTICCPICRKNTTLTAEGVSGLPSNFMFREIGQKLKEMSGKQKKEHCQKCESDGKETAVSMVCLDCGFYLCAPCADAHVRLAAFASHTITQHTGNAHCNKHKQFAKYYCNTCNVTLCGICVSDSQHESHSSTIKPISERKLSCTAELNRYKNVVEQMQHSLNNQVQVMESQVENVKFNIQNQGELVKQQVDTAVGDLLAKFDKLCGPIEEQTEKMSVMQVELMQLIERLSSIQTTDLRTMISLKNDVHAAIASGQHLVTSNDVKMDCFTPSDIVISLGSLRLPTEPDETDDGHEHDEDSVIVYLENIAKETNEDALNELFKNYGSTLHAKVVTL